MYCTCVSESISVVHVRSALLIHGLNGLSYTERPLEGDKTEDKRVSAERARSI